jgi:hypothetical protein
MASYVGVPPADEERALRSHEDLDTAGGWSNLFPSDRSGDPCSRLCMWFNVPRIGKATCIACIVYMYVCIVRKRLLCFSLSSTLHHQVVHIVIHAQIKIAVH